MWEFEGKYTGEAKAYVQEQRKRQAVTWALVLSFLCVIFFTLFTLDLGGEGEDAIYTIVGVCGGVVSVALVNLVIFIDYKNERKYTIEITNDSVNVQNADGKSSFAIFSIEEIEYYDDFIVVNKVVLQKDLLVKGDWTELEAFLKRVEEKMDTEEPVYQVDKPEAEFLQATVKSKRIYEKFVGKVSVRAPVGVFEYFVTFVLEDGREVEYQIGQELYEKLQEEQTGMLVLINGRFFDFGDGEEIEQ